MTHPTTVNLTERDWCDEHDLPMRTIRTGDDRIVCWYTWWIEATGYPRPPNAGHCRPGTPRLVEER